MRIKKIKPLEQPGNSPDMNPIENLWVILKSKVHKYDPKSEIELKNAIHKAQYKDIIKIDIRNLIKSMKNRILNVVRAKGGHTAY